MDHETRAERGVRRPSRVVTALRAGVSYLLFAVGVGLLVSFFAPFLALDALAWHQGLLPTIAAPTERSEQFVDVAPLIVGVVVSAVGVWLR